MDVGKISPKSIAGTKQQQKKKVNVAGTAGAAVTSMGAASAIQGGISLIPLIGMKKIRNSLSIKDIQKLKDAADEVLKNKTNLAQKGVKIANLNTPYLYFGSNIADIINVKQMQSIVDGKNACFAPKFIDLGTRSIEANSVAVNMERAPHFSFHELGHAYNFNNSAFWKTMQKARTPGMLLAGFFALFPAFTKQTKAKEGEELTKGQKFKNGLRKASPLLAIGAMMPTVLEEGMASLRAHNWAKNLLDKNLLKKVDRSNLLGFASYLGGAIAVGAGSYLAMKIKDKSQEKRAAKFQQQMLQNQNVQDAKKQTKVD